MFGLNLGLLELFFGFSGVFSFYWLVGLWSYSGYLMSGVVWSAVVVCLRILIVPL